MLTVVLRSYLRLKSLYTSFSVRNLSSEIVGDLKMVSGMGSSGWQPPTSGSVKPLMIYNSLTRKKEVFVPKHGSRVLWYSCGPTVYDAAHMGHARNYVTIDILRRILQDYFQFDVTFVQNVTDIDDKIITKARQQYLWSEFLSENTKFNDENIESIRIAWIEYAEKVVSLQVGKVTLETFDSIVNEEKLEEKKESDAKLEMHLRALESCKEVLSDCSIGSHINPETATKFKDILLPYLDRKFGSVVTDHSIFRDLAAYWEKKFDEDMNVLNVRSPTFVTRVSEFIPQIIKFIEGIIEKGFAYEMNNSIYFDIKAFEKGGHTYAKLQPWNRENSELISEGEGSLSNTSFQKKDPADFALWKSSKSGEPFWHSPWGNGRPGWHIECSVMASEILGENIDIHSGGIDLCFPHHDNEMAQSEAYFNCSQWINYFMHVGHLHIKGSKMSKSLKNFITIQEALKKISPRTLRLIFLYQQWDKPMDLHDDLYVHIQSAENLFNNYFTTMNAIANERNVESLKPHLMINNFENHEKQLLQSFTESRISFHDALCDDFSTGDAMRAVENLIKENNVYLKAMGCEHNWNLLKDIADWITSRFRLFGLDRKYDEKIGWSQIGESAGGGSAFKYAIAHAVSGFRDSVRSLAIIKADHKEILQRCDHFRDHDMLKLGISLEDREHGSALIKLLSESDAKEILRNKEETQKANAELERRRMEQREIQERKNMEMREKGKLNPSQMFKCNNSYTAFDEDGIPTRIREIDEDGTVTEKEVTKSRRKKLTKDFEAQKKLHEKYLASLEKDHGS